MMSIEKASNGIRDSDTISDLQKRLCNLIEVSEGIVRSQVNNQADVKQSNNEIRIEISKIKTTLIEHLNNLEERLSKDLDVKYKESQESIVKNRQTIQSILESATSWKKNIDSLHPYASEIQLFQGVKNVDDKTNELELKIRDIQSRGLIRLELHKTEDVSKMETFCTSLGTITVKNSTVLATATLDINHQGQAIASSQVGKKKLSLISCFMVDIFGKNFKISYGCLIPGKRLLLSFDEKKMLATCNLDGSEAKSIKLEYEPQSFTLYDKNLALVTSWEGSFIQTLNLTSFEPEKKIYIGKNCGSITCCEGKI
ncbi:Hypothetical predicted protein [Mytilus galloprovincialis]|uniref:Uncharacterized protein n=1 Tax=Mytilus galloprovincialis TaxID=29158 RepID=A0A8B6EY77_MYTGA|nr:Hypothetical predicted protein [Mytilus galloprovincialis]